MTIYTGVLGSKLMSGQAKIAYASWVDQRQRCNNPKNKMFKYYGGKGLSVTYSSREFVSWWLQEIKKHSYLKGMIVCERINHDKGYFFGNIKLGTQTSNALESAPRSSKKIRVGVILISPSGRILRRFKSVSDAARFAGVTPPSIVGVCKGDYKSTRKGLIFRYEE